MSSSSSHSIFNSDNFALKLSIREVSSSSEKLCFECPKGAGSRPSRLLASPSLLLTSFTFLGFEGAFSEVFVSVNFFLGGIFIIYFFYFFIFKKKGYGKDNKANHYIYFI